MTKEERLASLLRSAFPPTTAFAPPPDLWPAVVDRSCTHGAWRWIDLGVAAAVALALVLFPSFLWLLLYHL